jgi:hypothetical protein
MFVRAVKGYESRTPVEVPRKTNPLFLFLKLSTLKGLGARSSVVG